MNQKIKITLKHISELKKYENNPRNNTDAIEGVTESIKEFGFKVPIIIDKNNVIIAGHTRYDAAVQLNLDEIPCIIADDLTEQQVKAFRLADNKVAEKSEWDFLKLDLELDSLEDFDMSRFGFDLFSIDDFNEISGFDEENNDNTTFQKTLTFPIEKKKQITHYLNKHRNEVISKIIEESEKDVL